MDVLLIIGGFVAVIFATAWVWINKGTNEGLFFLGVCMLCLIIFEKITTENNIKRARARWDGK